MHPGLRKLFYNLSTSSRIVENRMNQRHSLQQQLKKVKIVSYKLPQGKKISSEIEKLEKSLSEVLDRKSGFSGHLEKKKKKEMMKNLKSKEDELNDKLLKLNDLLAKVGKKVDEHLLLEQLSEEKQPSMVEQLEDKLYSLESRYHQMKEDSKYPESLLDNISNKISELKEKIRTLKNKP